MMNADNEEVVKWRRRERMQGVSSKRRRLSVLPAYKKGHTTPSCDPKSVNVEVIC